MLHRTRATGWCAAGRLPSSHSSHSRHEPSPSSPALRCSTRPHLHDRHGALAGLRRRAEGKAELVESQHRGVQGQRQVAPRPAGGQQRETFRRRRRRRRCCRRCCAAASHSKLLAQAGQGLLQQRAGRAAGAGRDVQQSQAAGGSGQQVPRHSRCCCSGGHLLLLLLCGQQAGLQRRRSADRAAGGPSALAAHHQCQRLPIGRQGIGAAGVPRVEGCCDDAAAPQALACGEGRGVGRRSLACCRRVRLLLPLLSGPSWLLVWGKRHSGHPAAAQHYGCRGGEAQGGRLLLQGRAPHDTRCTWQRTQVGWRVRQP